MEEFLKALFGVPPPVYITLGVLAVVIFWLLKLLSKKEASLETYNKTLQEHTIILTGMSKLIDTLIM